MASDTLGSARSADRPRGHDGLSDAEALIFAATERLLETVPLERISVAKIVAEAGTSRATFYFYFSSKFAVVTSLLARVMDEIYVTIAPFLSRDQSEAPEVALRAVLEAATKLWHEHRFILRAAHEHWQDFDELGALWLGIVDAFTGALTAQFDREREAGLLSADVQSTRRMAAALLWSTQNCLYVAGLGLDPDLPDERAIVEPLVALWVGALYGRPA